MSSTIACSSAWYPSVYLLRLVTLCAALLWLFCFRRLFVVGHTSTSSVLPVGCSMSIESAAARGVGRAASCSIPVAVIVAAMAGERGASWRAGLGAGWPTSSRHA